MNSPLVMILSAIFVGAGFGSMVAVHRR
jgi:hypothetical protein